VICMKDKGKKAGMTLVIAVGPKMPKKPTETSKPDEKAMKKAWEFLKFEPGEPLIDAMGRPLSRENENFDEYGLPLIPDEEKMHRGDFFESKYDYLDHSPEREDLEEKLNAGLHIDQEQLKRERPDLFEMPNPMDKKPDPSPPRREAPPEATDYYRNAINEILSQVNRQNSPIERRSPPQRL
jgi:hypothetical protein